VEDIEARMDTLPAMDVTEVVERTLERILNASSAEAIFADPDTAGLRDYTGHVIILNDIIGCLPSTKKGPLSRYVVLDCTDTLTGEQFVATTGSLYAASAALRAKEAGILPQKLKVVELESASNPGQTSLWLVKA
jgi:hypothetical protein